MPLDIFYANDLIDVLHVGSTEDIEIARLLMVELASEKPGWYFVAERESQRVIARVDTTNSGEIDPDSPKGRQKQLCGFVFVLRYTGFRIGDVMALKNETVQDGKLWLRTAKTGTQVWIPLKDEVRKNF